MSRTSIQCSEKIIFYIEWSNWKSMEIPVWFSSGSWKLFYAKHSSHDIQQRRKERKRRKEKLCLNRIFFCYLLLLSWKKENRNNFWWKNCRWKSSKWKICSVHEKTHVSFKSKWKPFFCGKLSIDWLFFFCCFPDGSLNLYSLFSSFLNRQSSLKYHK